MLFFLLSMDYSIGLIISIPKNKLFNNFLQLSGEENKKNIFLMIKSCRKPLKGIFLVVIIMRAIEAIKNPKKNDFF